MEKQRLGIFNLCVDCLRGRVTMTSVKARLDHLVFCPLDGGDIHVVGGGAHIFILLVSKNVNTNQVHLQDNKTPT